MLASKRRDLARKLATLSLDGEGQLSLERVQAVLATVANRSPHHLKPLLKDYLHFVRRELRHSEALVEYAGELSATVLESITTNLSASKGRRVTAQTRENPDLIAGLRVRLGDDVYENSIRQRLEALSRAVHA